MGKKQKAPMWSEIEDVRRLKVGDILVWPKEPGKIKRLHGSDSTLRGLGFSIGRRWNAIRNETADFLRERSDENRVFMVIGATSMPVGNSPADAMTFSSPYDENISIKAVVEFVEIPLRGARPGEYSEAVADAVFHMTRSAALDTPSAIGSPMDHFGSDDLDVIVEDAVDFASRSGIVTDRVWTTAAADALKDAGPDPFDCETAAQFLCNGCSNHDATRQTVDSSHVVAFPVNALLSAKRLGARAVRPTVELKTGIARMLASLALSRRELQLKAMDAAVDAYLRRLLQSRRRLRSGIARNRALAEKLAKQSVKPIENLFAMLGDEPAYDYLPGKEA